MPAEPGAVHQHLFQPGHAEAAHNARRRGWPGTYVAVCVLCGAAVDLLHGGEHS